MPGRVRVHRPSPEKEGEYKMRILSILNESEAVDFSENGKTYRQSD